MPTNPLGKGTCNIGVNMPIRERKLIGRIAASRRKSTSALIRLLIMRGLLEESPTDAAILIRIREGRGVHLKGVA